MTFVAELENLNIDLHGRKGGIIKTKCPKCGDSKHKADLSVNIDEGVYKCHRASCGWSGGVRIRKTVEEKKDYVVPKWTNSTNLSDDITKWFKSRGISQRTLIDMKITEGIEYMPQTQNKEKTIQFNYFRGDRLINVKYRDLNKNFKMVANAELLFYNENALDKPSVIITEGEMDALSFIEIGLQNAISVPNGASEGKMNLDYMEKVWERLEKLERVYLATDNDKPGIALRNELARRIGAAKCLVIDFKDCKDANEYLIKHGIVALEQTINDAKPMPISGIILVSDIYDDVDAYYSRADMRGKLIGMTQFDELVSFEPGQKTIITGIPNHGKSEVLDEIILALNMRHNWKFGVFSPENYPIEIHVAKLAEKIIGKRFKGPDKMSPEEKDVAKEYLNDNFFFINPDDENFTLENILDKAKQLVLRYGITGLVIDPFNRLEHQIPGGLSETNYIGKLLDKMDGFCKMFGIHLFLVAHPVKISKDKSGEYEIPNLYSINGSSNFFNKAEIGMCVYRNFKENVTEVYVQKVRFKYVGKQGMVQLKWNEVNGRYSEHEPDNSSRLIKSNRVLKNFTEAEKEESEETPF